jgi:hypothetical protein
MGCATAGVTIFVWSRGPAGAMGSIVSSAWAVVVVTIVATAIIKHRWVGNVTMKSPGVHVVQQLYHVGAAGPIEKSYPIVTLLRQ